MVRLLMPNAFERWMHSNLYRYYPERGVIPYAVAIGRIMREKMAAYRFDASLLDVTKPTPLQLLRSSYAYARYESYHRLEIEADSWALTYFEHCYFVRREDAKDYFYASLIPRYFLYALKETMSGCWDYIAKVCARAKSPYLVLRLSAEVVYHDQIGEWREEGLAQ